MDIFIKETETLKSIRITIKAKEVPHGMTVQEADHPPEELCLISTADLNGDNIYFLTEIAEEGMVSSDYEPISGETELYVYFASLTEATKFAKDHDIRNIW